MQLQRYPPKVDTLNLWILASQYQGDQAPLEIDYAASHLGAYWSNAGRLLNPDAYNYGFYALPYPVRIYQDRLLGIIPAGEKAAANNGCFNYLVIDTKAPRSTGEYNETTSRAERVSVEIKRSSARPDQFRFAPAGATAASYSPAPSSARRTLPVTLAFSRKLVT